MNRMELIIVCFKLELGKRTLEAIMQHGDEELPDLEDFLPLWLTYLGNMTGHDADRLILEAVSLLNDVSLEVRYAEEYAAVHPGLYLNILENGKYAAKDMVSIGVKAMVFSICMKGLIHTLRGRKTDRTAIWFYCSNF